MGSDGQGTGNDNGYVESPSLAALLLDYEMGREDERVHSNLTVALVGVLSALLAGIAAIVTGDNHFRSGDGYDLPDPVSAFIPLLPLAVGGLLVMQGISATLRGLYLRQVEAALRRVAGTSLPDLRDLLSPSAHELNQAVISPIRGRPGYRIVLALVLVTNFVAYAGVIYLSAQTVDATWMRLAMYLGYGAGEIFFLYQVLGATWRGRTVLRTTADAIHGHLQYPYSLEPRKTGALVALAGRSMWSYLVLPRPGEVIKWLFVPVCFAIGSLAVNVPMFGTGGARFLVAWIAFEYLTYQARYQWNDIRGAKYDRSHRYASVRARLPLLPGPRGDVRAVKMSILVVLLRISGSLGVIFWNPWGAGPFVLGASVAAWFLAIAYEIVRSGDGDTKLRSSAVTVIAGGGYAVRAILGFSLSVGGALPWVPAVMLSASAWAFGVMFVSMTWLLDACASTRREQGLNSTHRVYFPDTAVGRSLEGKPHFRFLLGKLDRLDAKRGGYSVPLDGEAERPLKKPRDLRLPWNVALTVATLTGVGGVFSLTPPRIDVVAPSLVITLLAALLIGAAPSPKAAVMPFGFGGALLWFPLSESGWGVGLAGVGLWLIIVGNYLIFRSSSYQDLTIAPIRTMVALLDGAGAFLTGSSWELLRPRGLGAIERRAAGVNSRSTGPATPTAKRRLVAGIESEGGTP